MIETVYVEREVSDHPRTRRVLDRLRQSRRIEIDRFGEVFNRKRQDFRLQKRQPALILAAKHGRKILPTPPGYGIGHRHNFYFSHLLNCLYDCRYCFLQGMFRSAHYVLFVNWDDFATEIAQTAGDGVATCFFSGYDCDSLALDKLTGFADDALDVFAEVPDACLELRTKSVQVDALKDRDALVNCVVAMSFTPQAVSAELESNVPSVERRLAVLADLAVRGWPVGLRFDPLIWRPDFEALYRDLFVRAFELLPAESIHSVSFGGFRMPSPFLRRLERLYPDDSFLAGEFLAAGDGGDATDDREATLLAWCRRELCEFIAPERVFECTTLDSRR